MTPFCHANSSLTVEATVLALTPQAAACGVGIELQVIFFKFAPVSRVIGAHPSLI